MKHIAMIFAALTATACFTPNPKPVTNPTITANPEANYPGASNPSTPDASGPKLAASGKKLLEYGWDKPQPAQVSTAQLEASVFDGVIFKLSAGDQVLTKQPLPVKEFNDDIAGLRAIKSKKLENSFTSILVNADQDFDWFDDASWNSSLTNFAQVARVAKQGGLRGVMFDSEPYGFNLWDYAAQAKAKSVSFTQYQAKVRQRGAQAIRAFEKEYPGMTFFTFWWLSIFDYDFAAAKASANPYANLRKQLETDNSGLWAAFIEGLIEGASSKAVFIDGNEGSYYFLRGKDFDASKARAQNDLIQFVSPDLQAKHRQQVRFGNSVYVDGLMNLFDSARFFGYYLKSDQDRLKMLAQNVYHGLRTSDEFVWAYSETPDFWKKTKIPAGLEANLARARSEFAAGKPLSNDPSAAINAAEVAFKARVEVGGDMIGTGGRTPDFGAMKNHCGTWSNATRWSCTQAAGSSFTVTPKLDGVTFDPPSRSFSNLRDSKWDQHFKAK